MLTLFFQLFSLQFGTQDWIEAGVIFALVVLNVSGESHSLALVHPFPR